jgi:hypothetical protein
MPTEKRVAVQMKIGQAYNRHTGIFAGINDYGRRSSSENVELRKHEEP